MKPTIFFTLLFVLLKTELSVSQDLHFTNYRSVSNNFNPAQTGDFLGRTKYQGSTRTQYEHTYNQSVAGLQFNYASPFRDNDWIGAGFNLNYDLAGALSFRALGGDLNLAYHMSLDEKGKNILSAGGGIGLIDLSTKGNDYRSELTILGNPDPDISKVENFSVKVITYSSGLYFKSRIGKSNFFRTGISMMYMNNPTFDITGQQKNSSLGSRINVFASYSVDVSELINLGPAVYTSFSERQNNINLQLLSEIKISKEYKWRGVAGISHRVGESVDIIAGYKTDNIYISLAFDILTSTTAEILQNPGAIELGAYYIIPYHKRPAPKPVILCPRI
ncbi:MAG: PorP/SprF family type IX secretion system membrane protein [Saprospiraceae bacterium]|nr:PorP/SprF family type IX secretion system membrane protein [Saprospiraceae bacterium]